MKRSIIAFVALLALSGISGASIVTYSGSLSTPSGDGLVSVGDWLEGQGGLTVNWCVTPNGDGTWHYKYYFEDGNNEALEKKVSHFIISVSSNLTCSDVFNFEGDVDEREIGWFSDASPANPGFPAGLSLYGLKIDMGGCQTVAEFDSYRQPMWGDIYLKDGKNSLGDTKFNYAYNTDFGKTAVNQNAYGETPLDADSNPLFKILVPDTIPEPATLVILAVGGMALAASRKNRA